MVSLVGVSLSYSKLANLGHEAGKKPFFMVDNL
jgi:hypothetical protein